jgi:hypothetical protein
MSVVKKIISGGQTGADRAALDFAIARGIPHGGWCPFGRLAEDGLIAAAYHLTETPSSDLVERTEWNVRDSDGTVIFSVGLALTGGSKRTREFALEYQKPCLHLSREGDSDSAPGKLSAFLLTHRIETLNVAGTRQSEEPDVAQFARETLQKANL